MKKLIIIITFSLLSGASANVFANGAYNVNISGSWRGGYASQAKCDARYGSCPSINLISEGCGTAPHGVKFYHSSSVMNEVVNHLNNNRLVKFNNQVTDTVFCTLN